MERGEGLERRRSLNILLIRMRGDYRVLCEALVGCDECLQDGLDSFGDLLSSLEERFLGDAG